MIYDNDDSLLHVAIVPKFTTVIVIYMWYIVVWTSVDSNYRESNHHARVIVDHKQVYTIVRLQWEWW